MKVVSLALAGFFGLPYYYSDIRVYSSPNSETLNHVLKISELSSFHSTPWLNLGLLQSLFGSTPIHLFSDMEAVKHIEYKREVFKFSDGGSYSLDTFGPDSNKILFIVPGLTGGSESAYIKHIVLEAAAQGFRAVVMNGRGINGTPLTVRFK
jgi:predicted alpha/beta-fold hydrolase